MCCGGHRLHPTTKRNHLHSGKLRDSHVSKVMIILGGVSPGQAMSTETHQLLRDGQETWGLSRPDPHLAPSTSPCPLRWISHPSLSPGGANHRHLPWEIIQTPQGLRRVVTFHTLETPVLRDQKEAGGWSRLDSLVLATVWCHGNPGVRAVFKFWTWLSPHPDLNSTSHLWNKLPNSPFGRVLGKRTRHPPLQPLLSSSKGPSATTSLS